MKLAAVLVPVLASLGQAQSSAKENPIPDLFGALVNLTLTEELATTSLRVESSVTGIADTRIRTLKLPWSRDIDVGAESGKLHAGVELGVLIAEDGVDTSTPQGRAQIDIDWTVVCVQGGIGWTAPLRVGWHVRPGVEFAFAYLENDAEFNAVAAAIYEPQLDGKYTNWNARALLGAISLELEHPRDPERFDYRGLLRYSVVGVSVFDATSSTQEADDTSRFAAVRGELGGATPWSAWGATVRWDVFSSWIGFYDVDEAALGFDTLVELGGGVSLRPLPKLPGLRFGASIVDGSDVSGWSLGLSLAF